MSERLNLRLGMKVYRKISCGVGWGSDSTSELQQKRTGSVVYIHPEKRYYTVEYRLPKGTIRESYTYAPAEKIAKIDPHIGHHKEGGTLVQVMRWPKRKR